MTEPRMITEINVGRTNYFKVKDLVGFSDWVATLPLEACDIREDEDEEHGTLVSLRWSNIETYDEVEEAQQADEEEVEDEVNEADPLFVGLADHLAEDWVAVIRQAFLVMTGTDSSDLTVLEAQAYAVNAQGQVETIDLSWIYEAAKSLGKYMTAAED